MATLVTHRWVGETAYPYLARIQPHDKPSFLLGCILVDLHISDSIDRKATHFTDRLATRGAWSYHKSCDNFLSRLDHLLIHPWTTLSSGEQAFVAGYLAHLAADEAWKQCDWKVLDQTGIRWWLDLPVPSDVILTAFDEMMLEASPSLRNPWGELENAVIPDIFTHVSYPDLCAFWQAVKPHVMGGIDHDSYLVMLERLGKPETVVAAARTAYSQGRVHASETIHTLFGGIQPRLGAMLVQTLKQVPRLWQ